MLQLTTESGENYGTPMIGKLIFEQITIIYYRLYASTVLNYLFVKQKKN
jgi:hypothetical protein